MPFAIVQTRSAGGRKELSVVPEKWLDTSIQGDILLWPNIKSSTEQEKLVREENSTPGKSWLKYKCRIKRKNLPSYGQAALILDEMSGCSSSDVSMVPRKRKKVNKTAPVNFQSMLNLPPLEPAPQITITPHHDAPPKSTNASPANNRNAPVLKTAGSPPRFQSCPKKTSKKVLTENVTTPASHLRNQPSQNQNQCTASQHNMVTTPPPTEPPTTPIQPILVPATSDFNQPYFEFDPTETVTIINNPASENSIQQCLEYLKQLIDMQRTSNTMIETRLSSLEKKLAHQSTQIDFIMDAIKYRQDVTAEAGRSFHFEPIDDSEKLGDLEKNLENESYRSSLMRWLRVNTSGDCADDRMMCVLDLIMTKNLQVQCTWTGSSRKGPKIPVMVYRRMLKVFEEIGTTETEIVTQLKLSKFFMKKLKNAGKRLKSAGLRRSTRHVIKKRKLKRGETDNRSREQGVDNMKEQTANQHSDDTLKVDGIQGTNEIQTQQNTMSTENSKPNEPSEFIEDAKDAESDMDSNAENDMDAESDMDSNAENDTDAESDMDSNAENDTDTTSSDDTCYNNDDSSDATTVVDENEGSNPMTAEAVRQRQRKSTVVDENEGSNPMTAEAERQRQRKSPI